MGKGLDQMSTLAQSLWLLDGEGKMGYKTGRVITVVLVAAWAGIKAVVIAQSRERFVRVRDEQSQEFALRL